MSATGVAAFDRTIQTTNVWLNEVMEEMGWKGDHRRPYHALRAVLHALRDRLSVEEATDLGAQLPMLIRGIYYEGWKPSGKPIVERKKEDFLAHIAEAFPDDPDLDLERVVGAVFNVLAKHVTAGEIDDVKNSLPAPLRALCP